VGLYAEIDEIRALNEKDGFEQSLQRIAELPEDNSELYYFGKVWMILNYMEMGNTVAAEQVWNDVLVPIDPDTEEKMSLTLRIAIATTNIRIVSLKGNVEDMGTMVNLGKPLINEEFVNQIINFTEDHQKEISTQNDLIYWINQFYVISPLYYFFIGDSERAIEMFQKNLRIASLIDNKIGFCSILCNMAHIYQNAGKIDLALKYSLEGLETIKQTGKTKVNVALLSSLALLYQSMGELDLAMKYAMEGFEITKSPEYEHLQFYSSDALGRVYKQMGNYEQAIKHFEIVLNIPGALVAYNDIVALLAIIHIELNDNERANYYFKKIEDYRKERYCVPNTDQLYRLVKALILKQKKRTMSRAKAQELFQKIIDEGQVACTFDIVIIASINLIELLLDELSMYQENEILIEAQDLINKMRKYAQENYLYPDLVNALLLQSRLSLVQGDISSAYKILDQADLIAEEKNLNRYKNRVKREKELQNSEINRWKVLSDKSSSFRERLDMANLRDYIIKMKGIKHPLDI
jgi:tetratricopeptide (TPR) repeat protein